MTYLLHGVILFDIFQAIARSHRYGQTKTCLVFKLMVKDSAEGMNYCMTSCSSLIEHSRTHHANREEKACSRSFNCSEDG